VSDKEVEEMKKITMPLFKKGQGPYDKLQTQWHPYTYAITPQRNY
jgi:hypothetical protein